MDRAKKKIVIIITTVVIILLIASFTGYRLRLYLISRQDVPKKEAILEEIVEETEEEEIPQDIINLINKADEYYYNGEYDKAVKTYRDAIIKIDNSTLSTETKESLKNEFSQRYEHAKKIVDIAKMHHANAMVLQYEKRFEEAIEELEEALKIYPKYQTAIDALNTLKSLMDLNG